MIDFVLCLGPVTLKLSNGLFMLFVSPNAPFPPGVRPSLHEGMRADHLTIPLKPQKRGALAGLHNIHLTYPDDCHITIATPSPEQMKRFWAQLDGNLSGLFLKSLTPVTSSQLSANGYKLLFFDENFPTLLQQTFQTRPRKYRATLKKLDHVVGEGWIGDPSLLDSEDFAASLPPGSVGATPWEQDTQAHSLTLNHYPMGIGEHAPGWYGLPNGWISRDFFRGQLQQLVGAPLWKFIKVAASELGLELDFALLDGLLAEGTA